MTEIIVLGSLFGAGAILLLTAQPIGASRPSLARQLAALSPEPESERPEATRPVFHTRLFEESLRPLLESPAELAFGLPAQGSLRGSPRPLPALRSRSLVVRALLRPPVRSERASS